jgi:hypothetical protein
MLNSVIRYLLLSRLENVDQRFSLFFLFLQKGLWCTERAQMAATEGYVHEAIKMNTLAAHFLEKQMEGMLTQICSLFCQ